MKASPALLGRILVWCDLIGRSNYGVWRLPIICKRLSVGLLKSPCSPKFSQKAAAVGILDGDQGFGHNVAHLAMHKAIELAKETGAGLVGVFNSNFLGACAYYVQLAAEKEMIGIAMSNSYAKVAAYGGLKPVLGTNPYAFGAPRQNGRSILLDMATSASAGSVIRKCLENGAALPEGIAIDKYGAPITDPKQVKKGALLPLGGAKGFGLALMVEILSAIITGSGFSNEVHSLYNDFGHSGNNGHMFLAIDVASLMPLSQYYERIERLIALLKASGEEAGSGSSVLVPGETRWDAYDHNSREGIQLDQHTALALEELAQQHSVFKPW